MASIKCDKCPYTATKFSRLQSHAKIEHNQTVATIKCDKCPFTATKLSRLKSHVKIVHDQIKDYVCEDCGLAFSRKGSLDVHRNRQCHGCKECGAKFSGSRELKEHIYICRWRKTVQPSEKK